MEDISPQILKELVVLGYRDFSLINKTSNFLFYRGTTQDQDQDQVLVKIPNSSTPPASVLQQLEHEFIVARELSSEAAIRPLKIERVAGVIALILESPTYPALSKLLGTPLDMETFFQIAIGVTSALTAIHEQGVVHKSICPENIFVTKDGKAKIGGFGLSSEIARERQALVLPREIAGNLAYIAPEQTGRMNRSVDVRSDLYTLGIIFYQLLTGRLPFTASDPVEWVHCHIAIQPRTPHECLAAIPLQASRLIMKLLSKAAEQRYQTAWGLHIDLKICLNRWRKHNSIPFFELGRQDHANHLVIPEKLYGREREEKILFDSVSRVVASGKTETVLVSGFSGVGKSALINEMHKALVLPNAIFAEGKFDQFKGVIPYATFIQVLQSLVWQLLGKEKEHVEKWRDEINKAVEPNGKLLTDLVPDLINLIGEQPDVAKISHQDARIRLNNVIRLFIEVFAQPEHPLVIFLDDLQWLDSASLQLVEYLLTHPTVKHLLILGAYRDNEVQADHPLMQTIEAVRQSKAELSEIVLGPLTIEDIQQLIATALGSDSNSVITLAEVVQEKTGGNPFFVTQFLTALADEGLLFYESEKDEWSWDLEGIHDKAYSQNVVDLMIGKLFTLPDEAQEELRLLACLGNEANLKSLSCIQDIPETEIQSRLLQAIQAGFLKQQEGVVSFVHDRVQEAAYALIPDSKKPQYHLHIGRKLLSNSSCDECEETIFDIVGHLNKGRQLIDEPSEKLRLAELNASAGRKARASIAYASAKDYFESAASLMLEDSWRDSYDFMFALYIDMAEVEYINGAYEEAERQFSTLLTYAKSDLDKARIHLLRMKLYPIAGIFDEALTAGIEALRILGKDVPEDDEAVRRLAESEAHKLKTKLHNYSIPELAEAPEVSDPEAEVVIEILTAIAGPSYMGRPQLYPLFAYMNLNTVLDYGVNHEACHAFSAYAVLHAGAPKDLDTAYAFSQAAIAVSERFGELSAIGSTLYLHGNHVNFWLNPFASDFPILDRGFRACTDAGNLVFANYIGYSIIWQAFERGDILSDVLSYSRNYADFARESGNEAIHQTIILEQQFLKCLIGETAGDISFSEESVDEHTSLAAIEEGGFTCGLTYYHTMKLLAAYLMDDDDAAQIHAEEAWLRHSAVSSQPMQAMFYFLHGMVLIRRYHVVNTDEQNKIIESLTEYQAKLAFWAEQCPANFACKHLLVAAGVAEIEGDELLSVRCLEQAVEAAKSSGFIHWEAMAYEAAATYHSKNGLKTVFRTYLRRARYCYKKWGSGAKVRQLDSKYTWLVDEVAAKGSSTTSIRVEQLDMMALLKAQHAISSKMVPERLAETLLGIVMEAAGAQSGYLSIEPDLELFAAVGPDKHIQIDREPSSVFPGIAQSILSHVRLTHDLVRIQDAEEDAGKFFSDPHLQKSESKSILCLPIIQKAEFLGLLYLENSLVSGAFTPDQSTVLETLAAQAAISLENANLYTNLIESENNFRTLLEMAQTAIVVHGVESQIISANAMAQEMLGVSEEQLIGMDADDPAWHFLREDGSVMPKAEYPVSLALKSTVPIQNYVVGIERKDRSEPKWALVSAIPLHDDADSVTQIIVSFIDITEQKESEKKLLASEQLFRTLVENSPDYIARYDLDLRRLYVNPALRQQFEEPVGNLLGKTTKETSSPLLAPDRYMANIRKVIETSAERSDELAHKGKDGEIHWASMRFAPELDSDGRVESVLVISNDITEQKRAEEQLQSYLGFLKNLDRINRVLQSEGDLNSILNNILSEVIEIFDCDRAYLEYPCDPDAVGEWHMPFECCRPEYPNPFPPGESLPFHPHMVESMRAMLETDGPVKIGADSEITIPAEITKSIGVNSLLAMAIYPSVDKPWQFGVHQCSFARVWTKQEMRLFEEIARRVSDGLNSLLIARDLRKSEARYRELFDSSPLPITEDNYSAIKSCLDSHMTHSKESVEVYLDKHPEVVHECAQQIHILDVNRAALAFFEADTKREILKEFSQIFLPETLTDFQKVLVALMSGETNFAFESVIQTVTGRRHNIMANFSVAPGYEQSLGRVLTSLVDITERKRQEEQLRLAASVFSNSQESILVSDADNCIIDVNPAFTRITGYTRDDVLGKDPSILSSDKHDDDFYRDMWESINSRGEWRGEIWNRRKSGEEFVELLSIVAVKDARGELQHYVGAFTDITLLKQHEADLSHIAHYDMLTAVPNRRLLDDRLDQAIANANRHNKNLAVCYLDLDGFKPINDDYGHEAGDLVLVEIANRLQGMLRAADTIARLGGDEFVLLWNDIGDQADCIKALERVLETIARPIQLGDVEVSVSASIGVTLYPDDDIDADSLIRHADHAMYLAKQIGKNCYQMFDARLERQISARVDFLDKVKSALIDDQFELYYQPKIDYFSNTVQGVEALLRWNDPILGVVGPKEFLPLIESDNLAYDVGRWVMKRAVQQAYTWNQMGIMLPVSINAFPRHIKYHSFTSDLKDAINSYWPDMPNGQLQIEIVESSALEDLDLIESVIEECRGMGVGFSLDDFGTGYSSLVYLRRLTIDELKIDQSFVRDMLNDLNDQAIVISVIGLGEAFGLRVVAEGVETTQHAWHLMDLGCRVVQGFALGRPMPAYELEKWYAEFLTTGVKMYR